MRKTALLAAVISTAAATAAISPTAGAATTRPAATTAETPAQARAPFTEADHRASDVAVAVERMGAFAGIHVSRSDSSIEVFVVRDDAALAAAARRAAGAAPLKFTRVRHSYATLRALSTRVQNDRAALRAKGVRVTHGGVDDTANAVVVGVEDLTPEKAAALARHYPNQPLVAEPGAFGRDLASRIDDVSPWNSGDMISGDGEGNDCSSGPAVINSSGNGFLLTAGHCFRTSGSSGYIYRVFQGTEGSTLDDPTLMGYAKAENPGTGVTGYDLAVLDSRVSGLVWTTTSPTTVASSPKQLGTFRAVKDTYVCLSGGFSGERCNGVIQLFDSWYQQTDTDDGIVHHVNLAYNPASILAGPGDSGGTVYQDRADGLIYISGIILRGINGGFTCPNNTIVNRGNSCHNRVWFGGIGSIMAHTGTTLYTP